MEMRIPQWIVLLLFSVVFGSFLLSGAMVGRQIGVPSTGTQSSISDCRLTMSNDAAIGDGVGICDDIYRKSR